MLHAGWKRREKDATVLSKDGDYRELTLLRVALPRIAHIYSPETVVVRIPRVFIAALALYGRQQATVNNSINLDKLVCFFTAVRQRSARSRIRPFLSLTHRGLIEAGGG